VSTTPAAAQVTGVVHKGGPSEGRDFAIHIAERNVWLAEKQGEMASAKDLRQRNDRLRQIAPNE